MTLVLRHVARNGRDLLSYALRTGRWWLPAVVLTLALAAIAAATAKVVVPTATYAFF